MDNIRWMDSEENMQRSSRPIKKEKDSPILASN